MKLEKGKINLMHHSKKKIENGIVNPKPDQVAFHHMTALLQIDLQLMTCFELYLHIFLQIRNHHQTDALNKINELYKNLLQVSSLVQEKKKFLPV